MIHNYSQMVQEKLCIYVLYIYTHTHTHIQLYLCVYVFVFVLERRREGGRMLLCNNANE